MDNNYIKFLSIRDTFFRRRDVAITRLRERYFEAAEYLGFQFWLDDQIAELTFKHEKEWMVLQKQIARSYYVRNLHYFFMALESASMRLVDPCLNLLRTTYETILKMYYLALFPSEAENVQNDMENKFLNTITVF